MEYTKGEWYARIIDNEWSITSDIGRILRLGKGTAKYPEAEANAKLCAAAPDMLEALHHAKEVMEISEVLHAMKGQCGREPYLKVIQAIDKAEGKP